MSNVVGTKGFRFGGHDFGKTLTVALWSGASAALTILASQLQVVDWTEVLKNPTYAALAVTLVNTFAYAVKQLFVDSRQEVVRDL